MDYSVEVPVGPVINLVNENRGTSYMSPTPGTECIIRVYGEEQHNNGTDVVWWIGGNGESFPSGAPLSTVNIISRFIVGGTDQYSTYFEPMTPETDSSHNFTGNYIFKRKDDGQMPIGNLVVEISAPGQLYLGTKTVSVRVEDYMSVAGIHYWVGPMTSTGKHGAMSFETAYVPPVAHPDSGFMTLDIYLRFLHPNELDFDDIFFAVIDQLSG